jgi:hypothetical protein
MSNLIGLCKGQEQASANVVELYIKRLDGFNMALNRINWTNVPINIYQKLLAEAVGKMAVSMAIAKFTEGREVEGLDNIVFPKDIGDFKVFYQMLIVVCKLGIAHHDIKLMEETLENGEDEIRRLKSKLDGLKRRE